MDRLLVVDAARRAEKFISKSLSGHSHHHFALRLPRYQTLVAADGLIEREHAVDHGLQGPTAIALKMNFSARRAASTTRRRSVIFPVARRL